ncbi:MBL fold metallo-hydrolase [Homoserinibacter sp. YIM 151385]|uniref:MBL fold metallo-hydrolase n=1 Tax=Homoserinibacter sp. YIM 151385 TaxID=2985506 RepID=UPI0022F0E86A|nr:MBL fold metallo-hydrolase [Homoserinibacter sp. YIM 151385]WBU39245.1 MBL fold metallo-hydrolase [Homoserinibacter sp. YIM 151385]
MQITKHEHACLVLEKAGRQIVIDPGGFSTPVTESGAVVAVVITHEHPDHWTPDQLRRIVERNPGVLVVSTAAVASAAAAEGLEVRTVHPGETVEAGPFSLRFLGGTHAEIHSSIPLVDNVAVLVDGELLHPGDSFTVPEDVAVGTLAVPASAPWMKIAEAMDYVRAVRPARSFAIHELVNSQFGNQMAFERIRTMTEEAGGEFFGLQPGETLDV